MAAQDVPGVLHGVGMLKAFDPGMHLIDQKGEVLCPGNVFVEEDIELSRLVGQVAFDAFLKGYH